jgi:signal transduction histidine kinase
MKFLYISIFYFISIPLVLSQKANSDISGQFVNIPSEKLDSFNYEMMKKYQVENPGLAISYAEKAYKFSIINKNEEIELKSLYAIGYILNKQKKWDEAFSYLEKSRDLGIKYKRNDRLVYSFYQLGDNYLENYDFDNAIENYLEVIKYADLSGNTRYKIAGFNQIGLTYLKMKKYEEALNNFLNSMELRQSNNIDDQFIVNKLNIALCYRKLSKFNKALEYFQDLLIECDSCSNENLAKIYLGIGNTYLDLRDYNKAKENIAKILTMNIEEESLFTDAYSSLAEIYEKIDVLDSARYYLEKSLNNAISNSQLTMIYLNKLKFAKFFEAEGNYETALQMTNEAIQLRDSIYSEDLSENIRDAYVNFEKYQSNQVINRQDQTIQRSYNFLFMLGIILILISIVLALTYRALTYRRRINKRLDEMVKQKTIELVNTNDELIHSQKELDSFLYRTSHDIRGPIATLMGLTKLARLEAQDHLMQSYLEKIEFTGNKLNAVISRLTNVSQINSQPLDIRDINIYQVINEVIDELKLHRNDVAFKLTGDTSSKIKTDKILLKIILENLLDNSFKFYDEKEKDPFVELNIQQNGNLEFTITDNGVGIDPEYRERVFELFFVANEKDRGTGIGLYQTQLAIKKLQGDVVLALNKKPTSFKVVIPTNGVEKNEVEVG